MLYATTRNHTDAFTAQRVLTRKRGGDGGFFVPYRLQRLTEEELLAMEGRNFNANLATMMNHLFGARLTGYDIDLAIGRRCARLQQLGQKIVMGEPWHNTDWDFSRMVRDLSKLVLTDQSQMPETEGWANIAVRMAVLYGMVAELIREGIAGKENPVDISLIAGDFHRPMAAWYLKAMGLPIGNIVCCCNENAALWDFICHGQLRTEAVALKTLIPQADVAVPEGLERLIDLYGGPMEVEHYVETVRQGGNYYLEEGMLKRLRQGIYVTVSSEKRILSTIPNAYGTHGYLLGPSSALAYAGLQDYRARTGAMRSALIFTERSPGLEREAVAGALGIDISELSQYL